VAKKPQIGDSFRKPLIVIRSLPRPPLAVRRPGWLLFIIFYRRKRNSKMIIKEVGRSIDRSIGGGAGNARNCAGADWL
jgi:hypothetical protein